MERVKLSLSMRMMPLTASLFLALVFALWMLISPGHFASLFALFLVFAAIAALGIRDITQTKRAILRNYPISGHARYLMEEIRPKIRQYFFEGEKDGRPFPRDKRSLVYQRAKGQLDKRPFGTEFDVYEPRYEWMSHSMSPTHVANSNFRVLIGGPDCAQRYDASVLNISAMSFGSLSANAIRALNKGAKMGGFAHDTGEGGVSPHHRENGGDIIWECWGFPRGKTSMARKAAVINRKATGL